MGTQKERRSQSAATVPIVLTIAGSDSSAGAGIQADLKTFSALGVYGLTAITCVVAEIPGKVSRIEPVSTDLVREQIAVLFRNFPIAAVKTGLLCSAEIVETVAQSLVSLSNRGPLVVDPVTVATSGDLLLAQNAIEWYESKLFKLATLITPNLDEAARLLGTEIKDRQSMEKAVQALATKYQVAVLLKGGHLKGDTATDFLCQHGKLTEFVAPRLPDIATHGTGCTYSAAITAGLAFDLSLKAAIRRAKKFVTRSIRHHFRWTSHSRKHLDALRHL